LIKNKDFEVLIDIEKFSDGVNKEDLREVKRVSRKVALSHFGISE
jgi:hypothetical protein